MTCIQEKRLALKQKKIPKETDSNPESVSIKQGLPSDITIDPTKEELDKAREEQRARVAEEMPRYKEILEEKKAEEQDDFGVVMEEEESKEQSSQMLSFLQDFYKDMNIEADFLDQGSKVELS